MTTLEMVHICPVHGRTYGTEPTQCHDDWHRQCEEATYGPPCMACGYISHDVPTDTDQNHDEMCCGTTKCSMGGDYCSGHNK